MSALYMVLTYFVTQLSWKKCISYEELIPNYYKEKHLDTLTHIYYRFSKLWKCINWDKEENIYNDVNYC